MFAATRMDKIASPQQLQEELQDPRVRPQRESVTGCSGIRPERPGGSGSGEDGLYDTIRAGDRVTIVDRFGKEHTGRAVMRDPAGWVLNMGGAHGRPGIAHEENVTNVKKKKG